MAEKDESGPGDLINGTALTKWKLNKEWIIYRSTKAIRICTGHGNITPATGAETNMTPATGAETNMTPATGAGAKRVAVNTAFLP